MSGRIDEFDDCDDFINCDHVCWDVYEVGGYLATIKLTCV